jgi:hypothetical protein
MINKEDEKFLWEEAEEKEENVNNFRKCIYTLDIAHTHKHTHTHTCKDPLPWYPGS